MEEREVILKLKYAAEFIALFKGDTTDIDDVISFLSGEKHSTVLKTN